MAAVTFTEYSFGVLLDSLYCSHTAVTLSVDIIDW